MDVESLNKLVDDDGVVIENVAQFRSKPAAG